MHSPDKPEEVARGLTEARRLHEDLTANWDAFCDADPLPCDREDFLSRLLDRDFVELVAVDDDALDDPFAYERGIEPGGMMWRLTAAGLAVRAHLQKGNPDE